MMGGKKCPLHKAAVLLVWVGALNWGLVGALDFNLVNKLLGAWPTVEKVAYILVGVSALLMFLAGKCKRCGNCESCEAPKKT